MFKRMLQTLIGIAPLAVCTCIERNNPFDPLNFNPHVSLSAQTKQQIRDTSSAALDTARLALLDMQWSLHSAIAYDSARNAGIIRSNCEVRDTNEARKIHNQAVAVHNDTVTDAAQLAYQAALDTLQLLAGTASASQIDTTPVIIARLKARTHMDSVNEAYTPDVIYPASYRDSIMQPFDSVLHRARQLITRAEKRNAAVRDSNEAITAYNANVSVYNDSVAAFNNEVSVRRQYPRQQPIAAAGEIASAVRDAAPGDVILVDAGVYSPSLRFSSGTQSDTVLLIGRSDMSTVFENSDVMLGSQNGFIRFRNIVFRKAGEQRGVRLTDGAGPIIFEQCHFSENSGPGIEIVDSDAALIDCRTTYNGTHGVRISSDPANNARVRIENTLIAHNRVSGIHLTNTHLVVSRATIADNGIDGIRISSQELGLLIENSLITFNGGFGVQVGEDYTPADESPFNNVYLYQNTLGDLAEPFGDPRYISSNPAYIDRIDYQPGESSVIRQLEQDGAIIGYRP